MKKDKGYIILEAILAIVVLAMVVLSVVPMLSFLLQRSARARFEPQASLLLQEGIETTYNIFISNWDAYPLDGTYHPAKSSSGKWVLVTGIENNLETRFERGVSITKACRDDNGNLLDTPDGVCSGNRDANSRVVKTTVKWQEDDETKELVANLLIVNLK